MHGCARDKSVTREKTLEINQPPKRKKGRKKERKPPPIKNELELAKAARLHTSCTRCACVRNSLSGAGLLPYVAECTTYMKSNLLCHRLSFLTIVLSLAYQVGMAWAVAGPAHG